jgi:hypothetical protein
MLPSLSESETANPSQTHRQYLLTRILKAIARLSDGNLARVANFTEAIGRQQTEKRNSRNQRFFRR